VISLLSTLALCFVSFCAGVTYARRQHLAAMRRTLVVVLGRDVALPRAVATPTVLRHNRKPN
jgi:hypothetical protein